MASTSDIDDVIPTLVAYQIEWNEVHARLRAEPAVRGLVETYHAPSAGALELVRRHLGIAPDDWQRLRRGWGVAFLETLRRIAAAEKDFTVRLLGGSHVGYAKLTDRWWQPIGSALAEQGLAGRPVYFASSNLHSLVNMLSGYAPRRAEMLWTFLDECGRADPSSEAALLAGSFVVSRGSSSKGASARAWQPVEDLWRQSAKLKGRDEHDCACDVLAGSRRYSSRYGPAGYWLHQRRARAGWRRSARDG